MTATKLDHAPDLRPLYSAGLAPRIVDVPCLDYLMLDGRGDPRTAPGYAAAVSAIYALAYALKSATRRREDGARLTIMPLEALRWSTQQRPSRAAHRSGWDWTLMIAMPEFVTSAMVDEARPWAARKAEPECISAIRLGSLCEGPSAQLLHIGADSQTASATARLHEFIGESGLVAAGRHHEIYLSDPNRTAPARLKTLIRQPVATAG